MALWPLCLLAVAGILSLSVDNTEARARAIAYAQSNYASHGINFDFVGGENELPEFATLDGKITQLDTLSPVIVLNKTEAHLNCASGAMEVEVRLKEPFYGIIYADFDRNSPCFVAGDGRETYEITMPLKGCGTKQGPQRVFTNNFVVRFHPGLEMEGDEVITVVCRYPPPIVAAPPLPLLVEPPAALPPLGQAPLTELQIILIICAILFLGLLLVGMACSYYCLKKRNIHIVRTAASIASSEITKLSSSTVGRLSMFGGMKIPRARAPSDVPSDYPSESPSSLHSEVEDVETRSLPQPSSDSSVEREIIVYENRALAVEEKTDTVYTEKTVAMDTTFVKAEPKFSVALRVKPDPEALMAQEQRLQTVLEREESLSMTSEEMESLRGVFTHVPELHPPPRPRQLISYETDLRSTKVDAVSLEHATKEHYIPPPPPPPQPIHQALSVISDIPSEERVISEIVEPQVPARKPNISTHEVEDVFMRTITDRQQVEDEERHRREITEYLRRLRQAPPPPQWEVAIRTYPDPNQPEQQRRPDWETFSETTTEPGSERPWSIADTDELDERTRYEMIQERQTRNWDILARVLDRASSIPTLQEIKDDIPTVVLTDEDRAKWREIITTESTLRTLLVEASVREDYERIRSDHRFERLFEPRKWDVIIRVLSEFQALYRQHDGRSYADSTTSASTSGIKDSSRRTSMASVGIRSEADVRSMTEEVVNFSRPDRDDADSITLSSEPSSRGRYGYAPLSEDEDGNSPPPVRSLLARTSTPEFRQQQEWGADSPDPMAALSGVSADYYQSQAAASSSHFSSSGFVTHSASIRQQQVAFSSSSVGETETTQSDHKR